MTTEINDAITWHAEENVTIFGLRGVAEGGLWMFTAAGGDIEIAAKTDPIFLTDDVFQNAIVGADSIGIGPRQALELTLSGIITEANFEEAYMTFEGQICFTDISVGDLWSGDILVTNE